MEIVVLDLETTGPDSRQDSIIEISAVKMADGQVLDKFDTLIAPEKTPLNPTVEALTGITAADLLGAPKLSDVSDKLIKFSGEAPIMGHNISFDLDFLKANGIHLPGVGLDTLELAHTVLPKIPAYSLQYLSHHYNFPNQPSHRAMADVLATADLFDLLISVVQQIPADTQATIKDLVSRSSWDWAFIFSDSLQPQRQYTANSISSIVSAEAPEALLDNVRSATHNPAVFELPADLPQLPVNIYLAQSLPRAVLVVPSAVFHSTNWSSLGITPVYEASRQLDHGRLEHLVHKSQLEIGELKLIIKTLLQLSGGEFDPGAIYLTRDEFYLWHQKLAPTTPATISLPDTAVMSFAGCLEAAEAGQLADAHLLVPDWLYLTEWHISQQVKLITAPYLNAVVSSRRDFVHDYITDAKSADSLFKHLNALGSGLVDILEKFGQLWQELNRQGGPAELDTSDMAGGVGAQLKLQIEDTITHLSAYRDELSDLTIDIPDALERQIEHTDILIEHLGMVANPSLAHRIYLDGEPRVSLRIVTQPVQSVWQVLGARRIAIVSHSVLVAGQPHFISGQLGQLVTVQPTPTSQVEPRDVVFVSDLPSPKDPNYQRTITGFIKRHLETDPGRVCVVFPSAAMLADFFNTAQPFPKSLNLINQDVAGNHLLLADRLKSETSFAFITTAAGIERLMPLGIEFDRVVFVRMPFDPPHSTPQLLSQSVHDNSFMEYALPKAVLRWRQILAGLSPYTHEFWMLDSRLLTMDYGKLVRSSLGSSFREVQIESS